jgi:hypothetical protein
VAAGAWRCIHSWWRRRCVTNQASVHQTKVNDSGYKAPPKMSLSPLPPAAANQTYPSGILMSTPHSTTLQRAGRIHEGRFRCRISARFCARASPRWTVSSRYCERPGPRERVAPCLVRRGAAGGAHGRYDGFGGTARAQRRRCKCLYARRHPL